MATNPSQFASLGNASLTPPVNLQTTAGANAVFGAGTTGDAFNRIEMRANGALALGLGSGSPGPAIVSNGNTGLTISGVGTNGIRLNGAIDITGVGAGLLVAEGTNAKQGTAVLVAGTVTVANTAVTANSRIFLTGQVLGGTAGAVNVTSRVAGTSFTITSTNAADTSTVAYEIFEPG